METFPRLRTAAFDAWIADNSARGIHRAGLNGVASMVHRDSGLGLFVPSSAGLNYEIVSMPGLPPFAGTDVSPFEPRSEPMEIASADATSVTLIQKETSHSRVSAKITFRVEEPYYLHQRIELVFHRRFCPPNRKNTFHSLWASYMNAVPDRHIYVKRVAGVSPARDTGVPPMSQAGRGPQTRYLAFGVPVSPAGGASGGDLDGWIGLTKLDHGVADWHIRPLPGEREISVAEHLQLMQSTKPEVFRYGEVPPTDPLTLGREPLPGPLTFYYGLCHELAFIMMFKQPEAFRFAYSPCGGGKEPAWNPAWDYVLYHEDVQLNTPYAWDLCLALKPYAGRKDVLAEVRRYRGE